MQSTATPPPSMIAAILFEVWASQAYALATLCTLLIDLWEIFSKLVGRVATECRCQVIVFNSLLLGDPLRGPHKGPHPKLAVFEHQWTMRPCPYVRMSVCP